MFPWGAVVTSLKIGILKEKHNQSKHKKTHPLFSKQYEVDCYVILSQDAKGGRHCALFRRHRQCVHAKSVFASKQVLLFTFRVEAGSLIQHYFWY